MFLCFGVFLVFTVGEAYGISGLNVAKYFGAGLLQDETGAKWLVFLTKIENIGNKDILGIFIKNKYSPAYPIV